MNSNLLFEKRLNKSNNFDEGRIREMFENINIFLSRIQTPEIRDKIIKRKIFIRYLFIFLKMHIDKKHNLNYLYQVINSPTHLTGILAGHMRTKEFYDDTEFEYKDIFEYLKTIKAKLSVKVMSVKSNPNKWEGLNSFGKY